MKLWLAAALTAFTGPVFAQVSLMQPDRPQTDVDTGLGAVLRGLDRVNGETREVDLANGAGAELFGLLVTLQECRYPINNPTGDAYAFLRVQDAESGADFFEGWMIASAPALNALDHNRYDVWVLRCNTPAAEATDEPENSE